MISRGGLGKCHPFAVFALLSQIKGLDRAEVPHDPRPNFAVLATARFPTARALEVLAGQVPVRGAD